MDEDEKEEQKLRGKGSPEAKRRRKKERLSRRWQGERLEKKVAEGMAGKGDKRRGRKQSKREDGE